MRNENYWSFTNDFRNTFKKFKQIVIWINAELKPVGQVFQELSLV